MMPVSNNENPLRDYVMVHLSVTEHPQFMAEEDVLHNKVRLIKAMKVLGALDLRTAKVSAEQIVDQVEKDTESNVTFLVKSSITMGELLSCVDDIRKGFNPMRVHVSLRLNTDFIGIVFDKEVIW